MNRKLFLLLWLACVSLLLKAQEATEAPSITFKKKFLINKPVSSLEEVDSTRSLHLMIGGNIYQTEKHVNCSYSKASGKYDFRDEFRYIQPILNLGDISIANLKASFGNNVGNMFSVPDEFALALKYSGINTIMHANIHTANVDKATLKRTRDLLNEFDMYHTGAYINAAERLGNYPLIINEKGFRIAVLNYTRIGVRPSISNDFLINDADRFWIEKDMRQVRASKPDFVIVYFDWGVNEQDIPSTGQQELVRYTFEQGANLIVGTLPNNPMRLDYMNYYYGGASREGIVAYSLGNLIGSNEDIRHRNGYIIDMELSKNDYTGETKIADWGVIPVYTYYDTAATGDTKIYSLPASSMESGDIFANASYIEKRRAVISAYGVRQLLGSTAEEIQYHLSELIVNNVMEVIDITNSSLNKKLSPKSEAEIEPTAAPVLPVAAPGSNNAPSLAMLYKEEAPVPVPEPKIEKKKETAFTKQKKLAEEVFNAETALDTKKPEVITTEGTAPAIEVPAVVHNPVKLTGDTVYRIQFYVLKRLLPIDTNYYTHLKGFEVFQEGEDYKYVVGEYKNYNECYKYWKSQMLPRYKQSTIVKYVRGKKIIE